jgi:hypothetical protein
MNPPTAGLPALEDLGPVPYGYVKYRAQFDFNGQARMFIHTFADDQKKAFLNVELITEAANDKKQVEIELSKHARPGRNTLEIVYELFGAPNGSKNLGELKGIESVRIGSDAQSAAAVESWQIQRFPALMRGPAPDGTGRGREIDPQSTAASWSPASFKASGASGEPTPAFTWCRAEFPPRPAPVAGWAAPWKLVFDADRDALLYWNGRFVGRYVTIGPQKEFYLPEPYEAPAGRNNILTFVLAYTDRADHLRALRLAPFAEFSVRRTRIEFEY